MSSLELIPKLLSELLTCIAEHFVFDNDLISIERFCIHLVGVILVGKIEQNLEPKTSKQNIRTNK